MSLMSEISGVLCFLNLWGNRQHFKIGDETELVKLPWALHSEQPHPNTLLTSHTSSPQTNKALLNFYYNRSSRFPCISNSSTVCICVRG